MFEKKYFYELYLNCRRGMLELDIVLINFIEKEYLNLKDYDLDILMQFLKESDNNLYNWIIKEDKSYPKLFEQIIKKIKISKLKL